jgi:hypothetical protein
MTKTKKKAVSMAAPKGAAKALKKVAKTVKKLVSGASGKKTAPIKSAKNEKVALAKKPGKPSPATTKANNTVKSKTETQAKAVATKGKAAAAAKTQTPAAPAKAAPVAAKGKAGRPRSLGGRSTTRAEIDPSTVCREVACEGLATTGGYCRMHYIKNWKKIKRKEGILRDGRLNQYIEELVAKYPDKYIEAIRQDLFDDKQFAKVIYDLDLDEGVDDFDVEGESTDIIDNIKREFEDEGGETF